MLATANKINVEAKWRIKKGRYSTCITKKIKLNENKLIEVIYTAINSKRMNIVRIQKAQGTETTPA